MGAPLGKGEAMEGTWICEGGRMGTAPMYMGMSCADTRDALVQADVQMADRCQGRGTARDCSGGVGEESMAEAAAAIRDYLRHLRIRGMVPGGGVHGTRGALETI